MTQPPDGYPTEPGRLPAEPPPPPRWEQGPPTRPDPPGRRPGGPAYRSGHGGPPYDQPARSRPPYDPPPYGGPPPPPGPPGGAAAPPPGPPPYDQPPYGGPPPPPGPPGGAAAPPPGPPPYDQPYGHGGDPRQPPGPPGDAAPPPETGPGRRRGLLFLGIALAGVLVLCAGGGLGGWLLLRDNDRNGAADPATAVELFLQAVYHDRDAAGAAALVCSEARDRDALQDKINELEGYAQTQISPQFRWGAPEIIDSTGELAVVAVTVTMITGDELLADQTLHVSVLAKEPHGWWVCDLETVAAGDGPDDEAGEDTEDGEGEDGDGDGDGEDGSDQGDGG